jgi:hypothetical protein
LDALSPFPAQPDLLSTPVSTFGLPLSRRSLSPIGSHYARPQSLSPRPPMSPSKLDSFFSGSGPSTTPPLPEPASAILVSSSVRTYEPKTNFCRPVLHTPQQAIPPTSGINMYSESPEPTTPSGSPTSLPQLTDQAETSPLGPSVPSRFLTFGGDDLSSSKEAEEEVSSAVLNSDSSRPKKILAPNAPKDIAIDNGRKSVPRCHVNAALAPLFALSDSGYTSFTGSGDVMSKSSTSFGSSLDDANSQLSSNSEQTEDPKRESKPDKSADQSVDAAILIRPNRALGTTTDADATSDCASFSSLERKKVAKVMLNADGSISPGNTLERQPKNHQAENHELIYNSLERKRPNGAVVTPTGSLERKKGATAGARVNLLHLQDGDNPYGSLGKLKAVIAVSLRPHVNHATHDANMPIIKSATPPRHVKDSSPDNSLHGALVPQARLTLLHHATTDEAPKPVAEVIVAPVRVVVDNPSIAVHPRLTAADDSFHTKDPLLKRVIMPDVVPLQEKDLPRKREVTFKHQTGTDLEFGSLGHLCQII